jgi:hypothetical protein
MIGRSGVVIGWVALAAAVGQSACTEPVQRGARFARSDAGGMDGGGAADSRVATADGGSPDAPVAMPDAGAPPDTAAAPPDGPPVAPPDPPAVPECTPGVRACLDGQSSRVCSPQGRWLPGDSCGAGSTCSGGACVCPAGACEDGVLRDLPGYVARTVTGGDLLHYEHTERAGGTAIHTIDLRTGQETGVLRAPAGSEINPALGADALGGLYWCRRRSNLDLPVEGALMRGAEVLAPGACNGLRVTAAQVTFSIDDGPGLFRLALPARPGGAREPLTTTHPLSFAVTDTHVYFSSFDSPSGLSRLQRFPIDDVSRVQPLGERAGLANRIFDRMAADASHLYVSYLDQILRAPVGGAAGEALQTFWSGEGSEIEAIVLDATHVYWATVIPSINGCTEAAFWRRSKLRDDEPVLLARREGVCPTGLELAGERVYAAVAGLPGPSRILRLRR